MDSEKLHPNFSAVALPIRDAERRVIQGWADGFPDRDGKFVKEFQTTFNSSFWELYLHAVFKEYGHSLSWANASPDFAVSCPFGAFTVEAVTANAAEGKPKEWEKVATNMLIPQTFNFDALNKEGMIRISGALLAKLNAYRQRYRHQAHVTGRPFVVAVAPFEQPHFQHQYDRPIRAVLYDYYVDEDAFRRQPEKYPDGRPPTRNLGFVEKENGSSIPLGIFNNDEWSEVSAVVFSCTATMGKVDMICQDSALYASAACVWGGSPNGTPHKRIGTREECGETLTDGLQIYHNPYARNPLDPRVFRRPRVVQHWKAMDGEWKYEEIDNCLQIRGGVICSETPFSVDKSDSRLLLPNP